MQTVLILIVFISFFNFNFTNGKEEIFSKWRKKRQIYSLKEGPYPLECGQRQFGSEEIKVNRYIRGNLHPWIAAIFHKEVQICAGTVLDNFHILTAASCLQNFNSEDLEVRVGDSNLERGRPIIRKVERIFKRKEFNEFRNMSDIALLRVIDFLPFSKLIQPICIYEDEYDPTPYEKERQGQIIYLSGWGSIERSLQKESFDSEEGKQFQFLKPRGLNNIQMKLVDPEECRRQFSKFGNHTSGKIIDGSSLCATALDKPENNCRADIGSPLIMKVDKINYQIGILSWEIECDLHPLVFTRTDGYVDWISSKTQIDIDDLLLRREEIEKNQSVNNYKRNSRPKSKSKSKYNAKGKGKGKRNRNKNRRRNRNKSKRPEKREKESASIESAESFENDD